MFEDFYKKLKDAAIVPVVALDDAKKAVGLSKALLKGGIPAIEVTFRTAAAEDAIKLIAKECPEMYVGAGTVINAKQAEIAVKAGAQFIVSPGYLEEVCDWAIANNIPYIPGVCTPSDVMNVLAKGIDVMKFFPAEASGGIPMLKNLGGPFPQVKFMVTGGIGPKNLEPYATAKSVIAIGGSWVCKSDKIESEDWDTITALSDEAVTKIKNYRLANK
jgi:2-dehydro-3-deoxyphosphogluconate aldolase/(4S)-4-hydroxy-2-oxoglutarate aldolase